MGLYTFIGIGLALIALSIGIYYATRMLVTRAMVKEPKGPRLSSEPLYETPMPSKPAAKPAEEEGGDALDNPLSKFIEEWEEPKEGQVKTEVEEEARENPLTKFIEEWEEPKEEEK